MSHRIVITSLIVIAAILLVAPATRASEDAEAKAVAAAKTWLGLIDKGESGESWETAASLFKRAVTREQWEQQVGASRGMMGKLISREVTSTKYATSLPGAPDGEYVVIEFKTAFENKSSAVETVTPMKDSDGQWRVSGYYIK